MDLDSGLIRVIGKGGDERQIPLNEETIKYLQKYKQVRAKISRSSSYFLTRNKSGITRRGIYDRVKVWVRKARIKKKISPHNLRHTFATHALKRGASLVTIKELLGHRCITSTMVYLRSTTEDLRRAIEKHPANSYADILDRFIPDVRLPYQLSRSGFK